jgi:hypothetical protein
MATITQLQHQTYNIEELLEVYNLAKGRWSCVGYAPSKHRRCQNPIAVHNRTAASALLQTISHGTCTELQIRHTLSQIAGCLLCRRDHQSQVSTVAAQWYTVIAANMPVVSPSGPQITPDTPPGIPQHNTVHIPIASPGPRFVPATVPGAMPDAAATIPQDFIAQISELAARVNDLSRRIDAGAIQDNVSEERPEISEETHVRSRSIHGPMTLPVLPSTVHPNAVDIQPPIAGTEPRIDAAPDLAPSPPTHPTPETVQSPTLERVPDQGSTPMIAADVPSVTNYAPVTNITDLEDTQQDGRGSSGVDEHQHPEPQVAEDTLASDRAPVQPSRSAVRNARAPFIAAIEAQERLRREAEAEIARARQEREAQRRREEAEEQRRREEAERAERLSIERQQAEQGRVEREQAQAESRARQSLLQRIARREQQTPVSSRSVSEERSRDQHDWAESWSRYERDWEHMSQIDTSGLDEVVRDSLPWPVRSGRWQDVNDAAVRCFLDNAPRGEPENQFRIRSLQLLQLQIWRWHDDRVRRLFPAIADDAVAAQLTTVVMQTINAMIEEIRST